MNFLVAFGDVVPANFGPCMYSHHHSVVDGEGPAEERQPEGGQTKKTLPPALVLAAKSLRE